MLWQKAFYANARQIHFILISVPSKNDYEIKMMVSLMRGWIVIRPVTTACGVFMQSMQNIKHRYHDTVTSGLRRIGKAN